MRPTAGYHFQFCDFTVTARGITTYDDSVGVMGKLFSDQTLDAAGREVARFSDAQMHEWRMNEQRMMTEAAQQRAEVARRGAEALKRQQEAEDKAMAKIREAEAALRETMLLASQTCMWCAKGFVTMTELEAHEEDCMG